MMLRFMLCLWVCATSVFIKVLYRLLLRKLVIEVFEFLNGRMPGEMKKYGNTKKKKYFADADCIISNNFQTKLLHSNMNGRLRFAQVSTRSPLFYANSSQHGRNSQVMFKTFQV